MDVSAKQVKALRNFIVLLPTFSVLNAHE
uniref:Uncharacterized protein n=1 Tax=Anguilla anguilla TaxID=7936 RepID=A0A0E9SM23_ANGAN